VPQSSATAAINADKPTIHNLEAIAIGPTKFYVVGRTFPGSGKCAQPIVYPLSSTTDEIEFCRT
jgi:hypothetical protein